MAYSLLQILDGLLTSRLVRFEPSTNGDSSFAPHMVPEVNNAAVSLTNGMPVSEAPTALTNSAATACNGTADTVSIIVPYSATRRTLYVFNRSTGSETVDLGSSNVTINGGIPIAAGGGGYQFTGAGAAGPIYAISPVASTPISYVEA